MHRSGGGALADDAFASDARRPATSGGSIAGLLGQAFVVAWNTVQLNREGTQHVAERLISAGELYGDDVTDLLDGGDPAQARDRRDRRGDMARDLIPPPSPGRAPGARTTNEPPPLAPPQAEAAPGEAPAGKPGPSAFRGALRLR